MEILSESAPGSCLLPIQKLSVRFTYHRPVEEDRKYSDALQMRNSLLIDLFEP